ncbi:CPBP family intramembrane metalloprotease [Halorussus salilacus]|uniref:CPBP family intramembrane glutamic endopeptidase n=1 Tax=Halorussus salilacus TaxID=2953750 RepID=UPI00209FCBBC|nr:CPBP family intramembrane glutamic endopeptidase [Halorussus salilacus]USZ67507.1 CPBP family intramembrane metalloprotease [Halorussus salilacus]
MEDRSLATAGVVLAGIAFAAAALPWEATGVGPVENVALGVLGAAAFGAFSLRRHGLLARAPGALAAGAASLAVVGYIGLSAVGVLPGPRSPLAATLAFVGGFGGVIAAYGDGRGLPDRAGEMARAFGRSLAIGFAGLFAIAVWSNVAVVAVAPFVSGEITQLHTLAIGAVALGLGTGTVALVYFRLTDTDLSYLDFRLPTLRDWGYVAVGVVALFGLQLVLGLLFQQLGVDTASHSIEQAARGGDPTILLWLIPVSWLIIGPGEELLYRNIIQKSLYDHFSERGAVVVASVVFALVHIPAYYTPDLAAMAVTLVVILGLSLILGATYLKTDNVTVPAIVHGTFDAIIFGALYVQITGGVPGA